MGLGGLTAGSIVALSLLGCSSKDNGEKTSIADPFTAAKDTSKAAKKGGAYKSVAIQDEATLDPLTTIRGAGSDGGAELLAYSKLLREKGVPGGASAPVYESDIAESWEMADGGLRLTVKLRPNAKWDPREPTNSRPVNADDVVYSWNKMAKLSPYRSLLSYAADPVAGIESVTKVDDRTVVYRMAFPWSPLLPALAYGPHQIAPIEAEDKFDIRRDVRGSGPWMLQDYRASAFFNWKRNPNYYDQSVPYLDSVEEPIVTEDATKLAQFKAKNIWDILPNTDDVLTIRRETPSLLMYKGQLGLGGKHLFLSSNPGSPFLDVRVRRAVSMAVDREAYADAYSNSSKFAAAGLDVPFFLDNFIPAGMAPYWIDPRGKDMGDAAKFFQHNVSDAKALMSAAGLGNGLDLRLRFTSPHLTERDATIISDMLTSIGIKSKLEAAERVTVFNTQILPSGGKFPGDMSGLARAIGFDPGAGLYRTNHSKGANTGSAFDDDGQRQIDAAIEKVLKEVDPQKNAALIKELQKQLGMYQGSIPFNYQSPPVSFTWPWVKNYGVFTATPVGAGTSRRLVYHNLWIDESLKT